jgi:hypothetical protein
VRELARAQVTLCFCILQLACYRPRGS